MIVMMVTVVQLNASTPDSTSRGYEFKEAPIHVQMWNGTFYFFSLDTYTWVKVYDENGRLVKRYNVKKLSRKENTVWVYINYTEWRNGLYLIILKGKDKNEECYFLKEKDNIIIY